MKKKSLIAAAIAVTISSAAMPIYAEGDTPASSGETTITMYEAKDPTYTVTIPATVELSTTENTLVPVTASGVENLPANKKISVTFVKGSGTMGRLYLVGENPTGGKNYLMTLEIKGTDGEFKSGALEKQIKGMELASFTEDGSMNFELYPCSFDYPNNTNANLTIQKGVNYTASMTYGIALTDIQ